MERDPIKSEEFNNYFMVSAAPSFLWKINPNKIKMINQ